MNKKDIFKDVWVVSNIDNRTFQSIDLGIISKARELAQKLGSKLYVVLIAEILENKIINSVTNAGADKILFITDDRKEILNEGWVSREIARITNIYQPEIMLFSSTTWGRSVAPQVASLLHTGLTADCTELKIDKEGSLVQIRPAFGSNILAEIICKTRPQIATVRRGVFLPQTDMRKKINVEVNPNIIYKNM